MPEGPEVRVMSDELKFIEGGTFIDYEIHSKVFISNIDLILDQKIHRVTSYGKKVIFFLDDYVFFQSPLMYGKWLLNYRDDVRVTFTIMKDKKKIKIYYADTLNWGKGKVVTDEEYEKEFSKLGADLLRNDITDEEWIDSYRQFDDSNICDALLNQNIFSGIGNYIKSEVLFLSEIHPGKCVRDLSDDDLLFLKDNVIYVMKESYKLKGMSIDTKKHNYISPSGKMGSYKPFAYGRKDLKNIISGKFGSGKEARTTWYDPKIQKE